MRWLWSPACLATAALGRHNLRSNPGLEAEGAWASLGTGFVRDTTLAHSGTTSASCSTPTSRPPPTVVA